jgi:hypothetical protein
MELNHLTANIWFQADFTFSTFSPARSLLPSITSHFRVMFNDFDVLPWSVRFVFSPLAMLRLISRLSVAFGWMEAVWACICRREQTLTILIRYRLGNSMRETQIDDPKTSRRLFYKKENSKRVLGRFHRECYLNDPSYKCLYKYLGSLMDKKTTQ